MPTTPGPGRETARRASSSSSRSASSSSSREARWFAFLRAINVGGRTVKMERLAAAFHDLDFGGVETFIASGNVVFESKEANEAMLARRVERGLEATLAFRTDVFLRRRAELEAIAATTPFGAEPDGTVYVGFLALEPSHAAAQAVGRLSNDDDVLAVVGREVWWLGRKGMGRSTVSGAKLEKTLGMPTTLRNLNTVQRLLTKYES
ncbi:MAG TPA: DUF1697 domain-containing protein [Longimicrobiales bacterium]